MSTRGLVSPKGELFAYLQNGYLYTLDGEQTGRQEGQFIVDLSGRKIWRIVGDGVYSVDSMETVGYFSEARPDKYDH